MKKEEENAMIREIRAQIWDVLETVFNEPRSLQFPAFVAEQVVARFDKNHYQIFCKGVNTRNQGAYQRFKVQATTGDNYHLTSRVGLTNMKDAFPFLAEYLIVFYQQLKTLNGYNSYFQVLTKSPIDIAEQEAHILDNALPTFLEDKAVFGCEGIVLKNFLTIIMLRPEYIQNIEAVHQAVTKLAALAKPTPQQVRSMSMA